MTPMPQPTGDAKDDPVERFEMRANFEGLIQLLAKNLYPEPDVFVRELIQNAHDSIRLRQELEPAHEGRIEVEVRSAESTIVFSDNGLGMDREDIRQFLSVIGSTGTGTARLRLADGDHQAAFSLIGQFGIGMLSAFVVAERVTVRTRKLGNDESYVWENEGRAECRLSVGGGRGIGTEIVVQVAREHSYMLNDARVREAIVHYCDFLPLPVFLNGRGPLNLVTAPWDRPGWPSDDVRDAAYHDFVNHRYPDTPLEVIPIELEEPVRARGALYISDRRLPDMNTAGVVDIFVRRMFVRGSDAELLPAWAKFVRGVVESPDLQPTAARDNIRRDDWAYRSLQQRLGELIVERLIDLASQKPQRFREINRWHHYHLKGMALFHEDFFAKLGGLLLFDTNRGLMPLSEVFEVGTPDEPVLYFSNDEAATQFYRLADARGVVVINAGHIFEDELLNKYSASHGGGRRLMALDSSDALALFGPPILATEVQCKRLEQGVQSALAEVGLDHVTVQVRRFEPDTLPAAVLLSAESKAELELRTLVQQPWFLESLGLVSEEVLRQRQRRPVRLRLNESHPLIASLLGNGGAHLPRREAIVGLYLSAALNAKNLLTEDTVEILHRELVGLLMSEVAGAA